MALPRGEWNGGAGVEGAFFGGRGIVNAGNEARRIAANIAKLPDLLSRPPTGP
jgi:hypothetical protein